MKKQFVLFMLVVALVMTFSSCSTTNLTTSQVGWSNYSDLVAKDFDVVGVVIVESTEISKTYPLMFTTTVEGSRPTYADLMKKAVEVGADDIINVRVDKTVKSKKTLIDFFIGSEDIYVYTATATAIKYKDVEQHLSVGNGLNNELKNIEPIEVVEKTSFFDKIF